MTTRVVTFTDLYNFRDLGGYPTIDGRTVTWGRVYRSDNLGRLCPADHDSFTALGIRTVIDLRHPDELADDGRLPELPGIDFRHLHLVYPTWEAYDEFAHIDERAAYLAARYLEMAHSGVEAIAGSLRLIADQDAAPLVFHCLAGKDRTGIVAAVTLALLGVDDETVAEDYALSEESVAAYRASRNLEPYALHSVPAAAMLAFLAGLRAEHGSVEGYARWLGLTDDELTALRAHLLT